MWKLLSNPKTVRVTRKLAAEFADMEPAPKDRPVSERRIQVYTQLMIRGEFRPMSWASIYCWETDTIYRANGKHTSLICKGLNPLPELFATVEEYEGDTLDDVGRLYATYDSKMQSRTVADINRAFASCCPAIADVPIKTINACAGAMSYARYFEAYTKHEQPADRAERLLEHPDFVAWLQRTLYHGRASEFSHLQRVPVVACIFQTWTKHPKLAETFWLAVKAETGVTPNLPDRKLAKFLTTEVARNGKRVQSEKIRYRISDREQYAKCVMAWNAWRKGETTNLPYSHDKGIPEVA